MKRLFTVFAFIVAAQLGRAATNSALRMGPGDSTLILQKPGHFNVMPIQNLHADYVTQPVVAQLRLNAYGNSVFKHRLDSVQKEVPLNYNEFVETYIDSYTSADRREEVSQIIGKSKYYFPIYEKAFRDAGIPEEIKYLSIVESALNPNAVSRVGATGPWQFMFTTAKMYGLNITNYVDERRDPIQASYAAAAYLKDAYQEFGDWLLAIASYNCGTSTVAHAIEKANSLDYWEIRPYLPAETRGYVPAFIAVAYIMNYYNQHHIIPRAASLAMSTDTVMVNKFVSLSELARVLNIDGNQLNQLNPAYTKHVINGTVKMPRRMILPQLSKDKFASLYNALNSNTVNAPVETVYAQLNENTVTPASTEPRMPSYHKIKRGETLSTIADQYGIEVDDLIQWNHLRSNKAVPGQTLKVSADTASASVQKPASGKNYITNQVQKTTSATSSKL